MLSSVRAMYGYTVHTRDGEIGKVCDFYFDDQSWAIRYVVVDTTTCLPGGQPVLLRTTDLVRPASERQVIRARLTRQQVQHSGPVDTRAPTEGRMKTAFAARHGWNLGGKETALAAGLEAVSNVQVFVRTGREGSLSGAAHASRPLRRTTEVIGYDIQAIDGEIGYIQDMICDDETWAIRCLVVETHNGLPGRKILVAPQWTEEVNWCEGEFHLGLPRDMVKRSPPFHPTLPAPRNLCVSMFMPTYGGRADIQENRIALKSLLTEAEKQLFTSGMRGSEARQLLEPAQRLVWNTRFWQNQGDGLAVFLSNELFCHYRLPLTLDQLVVVTHRFHTKPLLPLFSDEQQFYVLTLGQEKMTLLQCTAYSVTKIDLITVPDGLGQALTHGDWEQLHFRASTGASDSRRMPPAALHGGDASTDDAKTSILRYFQLVDTALRELLRGERAPLVLAGLDCSLSIYKEASSYPHLVTEVIEGNPGDLSAEQLHEQAWAIVRPILEAEREAAAEHCETLLGSSSGRASRNVKEIVPAASHGRVETLFVAVGIQQWGYLDPRTNAVHLHEEAEPGDEDLLDFAAVQTLSNRGTVYVVEPESIPGGALAAAVFGH
jgi:hypothetical protein